MKLAALLANYLSSTKRLDLPGIGSFQLDDAIISEPDPGKESKKNNPLADVRFENNPTIKESPELVQFIASQTGKLKALAAADLESHLELIQQFLNIGKPFLLEGIGTLVKLKPKEFAFTSGQVMPESLKDYSAKEIASTSSSAESFSDYRKILNKGGIKTGWKKPIAALLVLFGVFLAVWGGYTVYKMTTKQNNDNLAIKKTIPVLQITDTTTVKTDSAQLVRPEPIKTVVTGKLKFIIEKANAKRAYVRFNKLRSYFWPVQLETSDSANYTIFMELPATNADISRISDSLTLLNGRRVYVEKITK